MIKPTELLRDLFMSQVKFKNVQGTISGNSATFPKRDVVNFQVQGMVRYCIAESWLWNEELSW